MEVQFLRQNEINDIFKIRFNGTGEFFKTFYKTYPKSMNMTTKDIKEELEE